MNNIYKQRALFNYIKDEIDAAFKTDNLQLSVLIAKTRESSAIFLINYMISSSPVLILLLIITIIYIPIKFLFEILFCFIKTQPDFNYTNAAYFVIIAFQIP
jgi:hypothetical protein